MSDVEEFEHIPWSHLVDDHRNRRTRAMYAIAALLAAFAVGTAIARTAFKPNPASSSSSPIEMSSEPGVAPSSTTSPTPSLYSEADLMASLDAELARAVTVRAEWFVTDYFTSDAEPITAADVRFALPENLRIGMLHQDDPAPVERSYVEWARAYRTVDAGPGRFLVFVAYRIVGGSGDVLQRFAVRAVEVPVVVTLDGGTRVIDIPSPVTLPDPVPLGSDWPQPTTPPPYIVSAAKEQAWAWGVDPDVVEAVAIDEGWRVVVSAEDDAGIRRSLAVWLDTEGRPMPARFHN